MRVCPFAHARLNHLDTMNYLFEQDADSRLNSFTAHTPLLTGNRPRLTFFALPAFAHAFTFA
jgi:hypothetical protein